MQVFPYKPAPNSSRNGLGISSWRCLLTTGLMLLSPLACAERSEDFAVVFPCEESSPALCLVGRFPSNQQVALVGEGGRQCQASTKAFVEVEGPVDPIPATRLDTRACGETKLAFAVLSQLKGALRVEPLQEISDKERIAALRKRASSSKLLRFDERKYREDNPIPLNDERDEWQNRLDYAKSFYDSFSRPPRVYRTSTNGGEAFLLRYVWSWAGSVGPVVLMTRDRIQLLEKQGGSFITFALGQRQYLFLRWNRGEGGYIGSSIWEIDEQGGREVFSDASFAT